MLGYEFIADEALRGIYTIGAGILIREPCAPSGASSSIISSLRVSPDRG
jgi:hypothetical protein